MGDKKLILEKKQQIFKQKKTKSTTQLFYSELFFIFTLTEKSNCTRPLINHIANKKHTNMTKKGKSVVETESFNTSATRRPVQPARPIVQKINMEGKIRARSLNVRNEPYLSADIVGKVVKNQEVKIIGQLKDWYKIQFGDIFAFVYAKHVQLIYTKGEVLASSLNVRAGAGGTFEVVDKLRQHELVKILDRTDPKWYYIELANQKKAYVYAKYIGIIEQPVEHTYLYQDPELLEATLTPKQQLSLSGTRTEITVRSIWNNYGNLLQMMSKKLGIETAAAIAVIAVESGGKGFQNDRMLIRFENHLFYRYWGINNESTFNKHFKFNSSKKWTGHEFRKRSMGSWAPMHSQDVDWAALEFARSLDNTAALISASYGLPQIIGLNYKKIGYETPQQMFENFNKDIRFHLIGLFDFFDSNMINALRKKDFTQFARGYNGSGQASYYGNAIKQAYDAFPR